jgi:Fe2+ or Zn2+ uptake regulation protein
VAEIQQGKIEQVDNQEELALPEMASNPQHNEAKGEEIVLYASCQRMGSEEESRNIRR